MGKDTDKREQEGRYGRAAVLYNLAQGSRRTPAHLREHILTSSRRADSEVSVAEADPSGSDTGLEMPRTEVACAPEQPRSLAEQEMQEALTGWQGPLSYFRDSAQNGLSK